MNRFKKAALALLGRLEPAVHVVPGDVAAGSLYCAEDFESYGMYGEFSCVRERRWYLTCEQAFAENPTHKIKAAPAFRIGDQWHVRVQGVAVDVQPKPKKPKGRR